MNCPVAVQRMLEQGTIRVTGAIQASRIDQTIEWGNKMFDHIKSVLSFVSDRRGVTALEFAMIAGIVVAVIAVGFGAFATSLTGQFSTLGGSL